MAWRISTSESFDTLENDRIRIKTALLGAELISFQINHPETGWTKLLVNDDDTNPQHSYWKKHAPFLFPIVGGLQDNHSITTDGKVIELPNHGFARISTFERVDHGSDLDSAWVEYLLTFTQDSKLIYPWDCTLSIRYTLTEKKLDITITIINDSTETMWFQFGWHPGFMAPISGDASKRKEVQIILPQGEHTQMGVDKECLLTGENREFSLSGNLELSDVELQDTFILNMETFDNRFVSLYDPESNIKTTVEFHEHPHLGIWAVPDAPYICLEPWQGCDDSVEQTPFDKKFGITAIKPRQADCRTISTIIEY